MIHIIPCFIIVSEVTVIPVNMSMINIEPGIIIVDWITVIPVNKCETKINQNV